MNSVKVCGELQQEKSITLCGCGRASRVAVFVLRRTRNISEDNYRHSSVPGLGQDTNSARSYVHIISVDRDYLNESIEKHSWHWCCRTFSRVSAISRKRNVGTTKASSPHWLNIRTATIYRSNTAIGRYDFST